jgi:hypothetical protein
VEENRGRGFLRDIEPVVETPTSPSDARNDDEPKVIVSEHTEKPPTLMESPYLEVMLELGEAAGQFEMPTLIAEINEFILSEFKRSKMEDTTESYQEIVNHYLKKLDLPKEIMIYTKVEKLHDLMMINKKLIEAQREKEELLAKPIEQLSSRQLAERIKNVTEDN